LADEAARIVLVKIAPRWSGDALHTSVFGSASIDQAVLGIVLAATVVAFMWGRFRYDMVAICALIFLAAVEIVPRGQVFAGFGHPAVVTVAAMLVISRGLDNSGVVDLIARRLAHFSKHPTTLVASHTTVVASASGFMNNVGALALLMPVAMRVSRRAGHRAAVVLMPLSFASLLGGMVTLIGTPPNIVVASARPGGGFAMFDFAPVGLVIAVTGVAYLSLVGWRLIPVRGTGSDDVALQIEGYLTEVVVGAESSAVGKRVQELEGLGSGSLRILAILRRGRRHPAPSPSEFVEAEDVLVVEAEADELNEFVTSAGLELLSAREAAEDEEARRIQEEIARAQGVAGTKGDANGGSALATVSAASAEVESDSEAESEQGSVLDSADVAVLEAVVRPGSMLSGRSAAGLRLRERYRVNLLAVARQGGTMHVRLDQLRLRPGDVLLLQAPIAGLETSLSTLGALRLAERGLRFNAQPRVFAAIAIAGLALVSTAFGIFPVEIAAMLAALTMGAAGLVTLRDTYESIDWPVLILLGAMLPVGGALETTGAAALLAEGLVAVSEGLPIIVVTGLLLILAMMLSDVINNVATVVLLIPIAVSLAVGLDASTDAFLMAVAVGGSAAFLTPIGHQSNVLVMGPGGYRFSDYWRVGLLLEILIVLVATPMIVLVWG